MKPRRAWLEASYHAATARVPEHPYPFQTLSNYPVAPVYTHEDLADFGPAEKLGYPGEYPYTRGVQVSMCRSKLWTMRQFAGFGSAAQTNARFEKLLNAGQTGLSTAFELPTLMSYDANHSLTVEREQQLAQVRHERNPQTAQETLTGLQNAAREGHNTMPAFIACAHATVAEQMNVLREVYGSYQEPAVVW